MKFRYKIVICVFLLLIAYLVLANKLFTPFHLTMALILYFLSWIPILQGVWIKARQLHQTDRSKFQKLKMWIPYLIMAKLLFIVAHFSYVLIPIEKTPLLSLSEDALDKTVRNDMQELNFLEIKAGNIRWDIMNILNANLSTPMTPSIKQTLREYWVTYQEILMECDQIKDRYKGFHQLDFNVRPSSHADAFVVGFNAFVTRYLLTIQFNEMSKNDVDFLKFLPDSVQQNYFESKQELTHPNILIQLSAGYTYIPIVEKEITIEKVQVEDLKNKVLHVYSLIGENPEILVENPLDFFEKAAELTWSPVQKNVIKLIKSIHSEHRAALIGQGELKRLAEICKPGDILLTRNNWELVNLGIPGFWTHSALYVGSQVHLNQYFQSIPSDDRLSLIDSVFVRNLSDHANFSKTSHLILDAGVNGVLAELLDSLSVDFVAVLRPRLSSKQKFKVLETALTFLDIPYDYQFDFSTDDAITSTELIWKALYYSNAIEIPLENVGGRMMLSPNHLAQFYDKTKSNLDRPFDFIIYIEGQERSRSAEKQTESVFIQTYLRSKLWHLLGD